MDAFPPTIMHFQGHRIQLDYVINDVISKEKKQKILRNISKSRCLIQVCPNAIHINNIIITQNELVLSKKAKIMLERKYHKLIQLRCSCQIEVFLDKFYEDKKLIAPSEILAHYLLDSLFSLGLEKLEQDILFTNLNRLDKKGISPLFLPTKRTFSLKRMTDKLSTDKLLTVD